MDTELAQLITTTIRTRAALDVLQYFHDNPFAWERLGGLAQRLHRAVTDLEPALIALARDGLLEARASDHALHETVYSYRRTSPHAVLLSRLMAYYQGEGRREVLAAIAAADTESRMRELARHRDFDDLKDRFVTMVSHELRTPITAVRGLLTAVLKQSDLTTTDVRPLLERALGQCDRLTALVENLLLLSGLQASGRLELYLSEVDLPRLINEVVAEFCKAGATQEIVQQLVTAPAIIIADEYLLGQVFRELIGNAVKFSPPSSHITVEVVTDNDQAQFCLRDEGVGLEPREYERVFEEFYQVEPDASRRAAGLGLGLYLARNIIERHGGDIYITPTANTGVTICFRLPISGPERQVK